MTTRCYLDGISKSYEADRTLECLVQRSSEFHIIARHFFLCFVQWALKKRLDTANHYWDSKKMFIPRFRYATEKSTEIPSAKTPDFQLWFFLVLFQVFTSKCCNAFLASSFRQVFLAQPYKARIWSASNYIFWPKLSVFKRAMINAEVTVVVYLNSFVQLKVK